MISTAHSVTLGSAHRPTEMDKVNRVNSAPAPDAFGGASPKQIGFLKSLARGKAWDDFQLLEFIHKTLGVDDVVVETLSSGTVSSTNRQDETMSNPRRIQPST
jgi:hypothetical protein